MPETRQQSKKKEGTEALTHTKSDGNAKETEGNQSEDDAQFDSCLSFDENSSHDESGEVPTKNQENLPQTTEKIKEILNTATSGNHDSNNHDFEDKTPDRSSRDSQNPHATSELQETENLEQNHRDIENEHNEKTNKDKSTISLVLAYTAKHGKTPINPDRSSVRKVFPEIRVSKHDRPDVSLRSKYLYTTILAAVIVAVAVAFYFPKLRKEMKARFKHSIFVFEDNLKTIQASFTNQTDKFWMVLRKRGLAHLRNTKPNKPLVFLLGAPPSAHAVVDCLAKKLAWSLDPQVSSSSFIDGSIVYSKDGVQKGSDDTLESKLENILQNPSPSGGGVRSALVMHLEKLPLSTAEVLSYKYCDSDDAPYKQAVIILTVYLPYESGVLLSPPKAQQFIMNFLSEAAWRGTDPSERLSGGLLSRISGTEPLVNQESDEVIQLACNDL